MPRKKRLEDDPREAAFYERRREDASTWSSEPVPAVTPKSGSTVFSLRMSPDELEEVRQAASARGTTISDLVRSAALKEARDPSSVIIRSIKYDTVTLGPAISFSSDEAEEYDVGILTAGRPRTATV